MISLQLQAAVVVVRPHDDVLRQEGVALLAEREVGEAPVELDGEDELVERVHLLRLQYGDPRPLHPGVQFNRHLGFRDKCRDKFRDNASTMELYKFR